jgi:hypothetical protein
MRDTRRSNQEAQFRHGQPHGVRQVLRIVHGRQGGAGQLVAVAVRRVQSRGDVRAQVQQFVQAPLVPRGGAFEPFTGAPLPGFFAPGPGFGQPFLAHLLQRLHGIAQHLQFAAQLAQRGAQFRFAPDHFFGRRRLPAAGRPKAKPLHFFEEDFFARRGTQALHQLGARGDRRGGIGSAHGRNSRHGRRVIEEPAGLVRSTRRHTAQVALMGFRKAAPSCATCACMAQ